MIKTRQFTQSAGVTGIVLTKLDGTAKGGIAVAIAQELNLPVRFAIISSHQAVKTTCTSKLSFMHGAPKERAREVTSSFKVQIEMV
jgi:DNA helicase TIP49 (TBP-interacting protein)